MGADDPEVQERLEYLRTQLRAECISYAELDELETLADHIADGDVELLEAAGVSEFPEEYQVEVLATVVRTVTVQARTSVEAIAQVQDPDFEMPPLDVGEVLEGCIYVAYRGGVEKHREEN